MQTTYVHGMGLGNKTYVTWKDQPLFSNKQKQSDMYLILPLLAAAAPAIIGALGSVFGSLIHRGQSKRDIADQNAYNNPAAQVKRLREAGLPLAADTGNIAGNQSALPQAEDGGLKNINPNGLQNFFTNAIQMKQLKLLDEEIKLKGAEAVKFGAETKFLMEGKGVDTQNTNLTNSLKLQQGTQDAILKGQNIANRIQGVAADNAKTRTMLENTKLTQEIAGLIQSRQIGEKSMESQDIQNEINRVILQFKPGMTNAEYEKLLKENNLIDEKIQGQNLTNLIDSVRLKVESSTADTQIKMKDLELATNQLKYDQIGEYFENYKQYQEFVQKVQDNINNAHSFTDGLKGLIAFMYTTVTGLSGNSPAAMGLLNHIK